MNREEVITALREQYGDDFTDRMIAVARRLAAGDETAAADAEVLYAEFLGDGEIPTVLIQALRSPTPGLSEEGR